MDALEVKRLIMRRPTEEVLIEQDIDDFLNAGVKLRHYIGFEISGLVHIGTGLTCMSKVADFQKAGIETHILLADWHTWINDKLGGDWDVIKKVAVRYFKHALGKSLEVMGGNADKVKFVLGSELYHANDEYWATLIDVAKHTTLNRVKRSITILGRKLGEAVDFAKLIYPIMQVADMFELQAHINHAGMDQRKASVIAREVAKHLSIKPLMVAGEKRAPICVHHKILMGFAITNEMVERYKQDKHEAILDMKMSKSKPHTCIFIHDSPEEIKAKIRKAYCPHGETEINPVWDIVDALIARDIEEGRSFFIKTPKGELEFQSFDELKNAWTSKQIHPLDLKNAVAEWLIAKLEPIRNFFEKHSDYVEEMKEAMKKSEPVV